MEKKKDNLSEWMSGFSEFLNADSVSPPAHLNERIGNLVHQLLNPSSLLVFGKLAVIAALASSVSLFFCPQFGYGTRGPGLMMFLMDISPLLCHFGCGVLFVGVGVFVSTFVLRQEELRVLKETKYLQVSALSASMLGMFLCFGSQGFFTMELMWLLGGIVGGLVSVYGGSMIRSLLVSFQDEFPR